MDNLHDARIHCECWCRFRQNLSDTFELLSSSPPPTTIIAAFIFVTFVSEYSSRGHHRVHFSSYDRHPNACNHPSRQTPWKTDLVAPPPWHCSRPPLCKFTLPTPRPFYSRHCVNCFFKRHALLTSVIVAMNLANATEFVTAIIVAFSLSIATDFVTDLIVAFVLQTRRNFPLPSSCQFTMPTTLYFWISFYFNASSPKCTMFPRFTWYINPKSVKDLEKCQRGYFQDHTHDLKNYIFKSIENHSKASIITPNLH